MPLSERIRTPVFIVGAPRSGTTLLRVTLNRHSQLAVCGETHYFQRVYARRYAFGDPGNLRNRERIVGAYLAIEPVRRLAMDIGVLRERLMSEGVSWSALFASMIQAYADFHGKTQAGEKTPQHALHVATLCEWFPDCSIIHLVRDPRAAVCSMTHMPWASRSVLVGARTWRLFNTAAATVSTRDNYIRVQYEELVARPAEQLRRLCTHIGLEYQDAMLQPDPAEFDPRRPVHRAYEKMTPARTALWRAELESWQVAAIEAAAGNRMEEFGYERQTKGAAGMSRASLEALVEMTFQKFFRSPSAFYHFLQPTNLADEEKWLKRASAIYGRLRSRPPVVAQRPLVPSGMD
jgi:LPS sulfotransferase NodH